ncbi:ferritin-like domain-containing protein [Massiliimalia massiliensis]|uniref:ferritin-like domain-containing protein n=1 Tax=Massiliimalia massiliensis TaxID=1852384 RepID=UPI000987CC90|nr:ferritin family protein [Massiliimalia massiliensis]
MNSRNIRNVGAQPAPVEKIAVTAASPYPEVNITMKNPQLLIPLSLDLASAGGELTAIYQYVYQSIMIKESHPLISETLMRIAIVEMHHLNLMGQMMKGLGGSPRAVSNFAGRSTPWNGTMPSYTKDIKRMLQVDLKGEQDTYHRYLLQSHRISDPNISAVIHRIAEDEEVHIAIFEKFIAEL